MMRVATVIVLAAGAVLGWLYWQSSRTEPFVVSGFIEADEIRVGSRVGGRVASVAAEEGRRVQPGDVLYELDPFDLREQLAGAQAELAAAQAEHDRLATGYRGEEIEQARARRDHAKAVLDKLVAGPRPQEIERARQQLAIARANLAFAESEYGRLERLREDQQAASIEYDAAVRAVKAARGEVAAAEQSVSLVEEGTRAEEIAEARAKLAEAEEALKLAEAGFRSEDVAQADAAVQAARARVARVDQQIAELRVRSPCDCVVEAIDLRPGDLVSANAPTVALLDLSRLWVRAYVPEARLGHIRLNQAVPIRVDSFPDRRFPGRITFIASQAEFIPRNVQTVEERSKQVFRIKVALEERRDVRVGMSADVLLDEAGDVTPSEGGSVPTGDGGEGPGEVGDP